VPVGPKTRPLRSAGVRARHLEALLQDVLDTLPERAIDDRLVLTGVARALVHDLADIDRVGDDPIQVSLLNRLAALGLDTFG
jgi:hypothetical protein